MSSWPDFTIQARCPICGARHDGAANTSDDGPPDDGSWAVCLICAGVSKYDMSLPNKLRVLTDEELAEVQANPSFARVQWAIREAIRVHGLPKGHYFD